MLKLNQNKLDKLFSEKKIQKDDEDENAAPVQEENIRFANFADDLKDKSNFIGMDIVFVLDATGSMGPYIEGAKECLKTIIQDSKKDLIQLQADESCLKFSVIAYRDHPPQDNSFVTDIRDFCSPEEAEVFLNNISAKGGGDIPEAVMDGLNDALNKVNWRAGTEKYLFLVLDAPPHGKRFHDGPDGFPDGCPCGYSEVTLLPQLRDMKIDFTIIKISKDIDKMIEIFSQYINIDVSFPKIFQTKSTKFKSTEAYGVEVKDAMRSCVNAKICNNLSTFTSKISK